MTRFIASLALAGMPCLTGCGARAVDLDQSAPISSAPNAVDAPVVSQGRISGVWIDQARLYWVRWVDGVTSVQSCLSADCEHTKLTYLKTNDQLDVAVADGRVYWNASTRLFSCPAEECPSAPPLIVLDPALKGKRIFAHGGYVYWSSDFDLYRCPAQGCRELPELVAANAAPDSVVFDDDRAYWLDQRGVFSAPSDGSAAPKLITAHVGVGDELSLAVRGGYLYWTAAQQAFRCPVAACDASAPTLLATAGSSMTNLMVDDSSMYWLEAGAIRSCPLTGCERSVALTPSKVVRVDTGYIAAPFALERGDVYWLEAADDTPGSPGTPDPLWGKSIRRTAQ